MLLLQPGLCYSFVLRLSLIGLIHIGRRKSPTGQDCLFASCVLREETGQVVVHLYWYLAVGCYRLLYRRRPREKPVSSNPTAADYDLAFPFNAHPISNLRKLSESPNGGPCRSSRWCSSPAVSLPSRSRSVHSRDFPRRISSHSETYETVQAPPATVFLQEPQLQMPTECRFTVFLPQNVQMYRACWVISIFLTCFRSEAPYLRAE